MGVFCNKCTKSEDDLDKIEDSVEHHESLLPKQKMTENETKLEEDNIETKNEEQKTNKIKIDNNLQRANTKIKANNQIDVIEENPEIPKSKTFFMKDIMFQPRNSKRLILGKKNNSIDLRNKRSNSFKSSKKSDSLSLNILNLKSNNNDKKNEKQNIINEDEKKGKKNFRRRNRKSATLMENKNILKNLYNAQLNVKVSSNLLVTQQKGNPSDKYIRGDKIGAGSFGTVFEAKNLLFNTKVAMKIIEKEENMNETQIKNEIDILKKLSHPNIVRIYEFYESTNCFYLINEYCDEGELYNYINNSTLNEQQLAIIFYQVFSGLCFLHANNILHRDLKPENILISKKEIDLSSNEEYFWIKIIDFGTAKIFEQNKKEKSIVGSAYYIAPDVLNQNYNEKCDTWSVGVILYMFLTGKPPFNGKTNEEIIYSIRTKPLDEQNEKLMHRSPEVRDLVRGLLEKDTKKRLSAQEALNHIWFQKFNGRKLFGNFMEKDIQPYIDNLFNCTFHSKIQQLVIAFLVHNLPATDSKRNILKLFRHFNTSGNCKLTKEELINGLSKYRNKEDKSFIDNLFLFLDNDNNGYIDYEEFLRASLDKKEVLTDEYLKYAFRFLDKGNKGKLTVQEINSAFLEEGNNTNKLFEIALTKDISEVDEDKDGALNFHEFKQLMLNTMN